MTDINIKPLEWSEIEQARGDGLYDATGEWEATSILGVYAINISTCGDMHAPWEVFGADDNKIGNFATLEEAKAAAQAHFEREIRSALVPSSDLSTLRDRVAELEGALQSAKAWIVTLGGNPHPDDTNADLTAIAVLEHIRTVLSSQGDQS